MNKMAARIFMLGYLLFCYQGATVMIIFNKDLCISFTIARLAHSSLIMGGVLFQLYIYIYLRARNDPGSGSCFGNLQDVCRGEASLEVSLPLAAKDISDHRRSRKRPGTNEHLKSRLELSPTLSALYAR